MASVSLRGLQVTCDTDFGEVACVEWTGLERTVHLVIPLADQDGPGRLQAFFDGHLPRLTPPMDV